MDIDYSKFEGHTPGPWTWNYDKIDRGMSKGKEVHANLSAPRPGCEQFKHPLHDPVLTPNWNEFDGGTWQAWVSVSKANAELIAAAPRLLAENARLREELASREVVPVIIFQELDGTERRIKWDDGDDSVPGCPAGYVAEAEDYPYAGWEHVDPEACAVRPEVREAMERLAEHLSVRNDVRADLATVRRALGMEADHERQGQ